MNLFNDKALYKEYTVIIGCGRLGANLANTLSDKEINVLVIDSKEESFRKLSPSYGGLTLVGDATDINILKEAELDKASVVLSVTNNDSTNIMVAQMAKELFKIEHVIARLYDPERVCIYKEFNIETICPALLSVKEINKLLEVKEIN
ncbi:MAG: TrkA family potassium uptake protein [Erysipelotrichaceae bacterium]